jgi:hypothetical protein
MTFHPTQMYRLSGKTTPRKPPNPHKRCDDCKSGRLKSFFIEDPHPNAPRLYLSSPPFSDVFKKVVYRHCAERWRVLLKNKYQDMHFQNKDHAPTVQKAVRKALWDWHYKHFNCYQWVLHEQRVGL